MNNRTTLAPILQSVLPKEELEPMIQSLGYVDTARKFTVYDLFLFLAEAAIQKWDGYRDGEQRMTGCGLRKVDHSTISKKAKDVPFELFKRLLQRLIQKCNRPTRRRLRIPKELLLVDSTTITVGRNRLPWAPMKGERSGVKLHVSLLADEGKLHQVTESIGREHDLPFCQDVTDSQFILVADRAYGKHKQFDAYMEAGRAPVLCNPATGQYDFASTHPERTQTPIQRHDRARRDVPIGKQSHADPTSISGREIEGSSRSSCCPCNQSAQAIGRTYCRNLSATVAGGSIFSLDQATPECAQAFRHYAKRGLWSIVQRFSGICASSIFVCSRQPTRSSFRANIFCGFRSADERSKFTDRMDRLFG